MFEGTFFLVMLNGMKWFFLYLLAGIGFVAILVIIIFFTLVLVSSALGH